VQTIFLVLQHALTKLYTNVVNDLANHDLNKLRKTDKHVGKLNDEIDGLKDGVFYFIKIFRRNLCTSQPFLHIGFRLSAGCSAIY
jgi:hypothetical protein